MNLHWLGQYSTYVSLTLCWTSISTHSGVVASLDLWSIWSNCSGMAYICIKTALKSSCIYFVWDWSTVIHLERGCEYSGLLWTFGARWIYPLLQSTLPSLWFEDSVAVYGAIWCNLMHWHCWWEYHQRSEFAIGTYHSCSNYDLEYVQFCDLVILWHRSWYDCDDLHICDFGILWHTVIELWWSEHLHVWRFVILEPSWFLQPWSPSDLPSCEFDVVVEELQHGNRGFTLFETKLAGIDTFQPWVQVASFEQSRLVFATWICRNQFLANRICDLFCVTERVWTPYFGGTKIAVNSSVNWVVAVRSCQRCFLWTMPGVDFIVLSDVICLVMTHVNQISSFELRLTHCDERLASEGDKHIQWMCVVCLWFGKKK